MTKRIEICLTHYQTKILDSSKLKEFADHSFKFDKLSKRVENTVGKGEIACYEQFLLFPQFFKRLVSQRRQKVSLCENGLRKGRKHCGKRRKCWFPAFSPFPTKFSEGFFQRGAKSRDYVEELTGKYTSGNMEIQPIAKGKRRTNFENNVGEGFYLRNNCSCSESVFLFLFQQSCEKITFLSSLTCYHTRPHFDAQKI